MQTSRAWHPRTHSQALYARATAPLKQNAFMCFMAWMTGSGIQIFSILMTFNLLSAPLAAIFSSGMSEYATHAPHSAFSHLCSCFGIHLREADLFGVLAPGAEGLHSLFLTSTPA